MKRMICIGAQSIEPAEAAAAPRLVEKPCRRDSDSSRLRTYLSACPPDVHAGTIEQLSLFEEHCAREPRAE
jgi:hypothetical protein